MDLAVCNPSSVWQVYSKAAIVLGRTVPRFLRKKNSHKYGGLSRRQEKEVLRRETFICLDARDFFGPFPLVQCLYQFIRDVKISRNTVNHLLCNATTR